MILIAVVSVLLIVGVIVAVVLVSMDSGDGSGSPGPSPRSSPSPSSAKRPVDCVQGPWRDNGPCANGSRPQIRDTKTRPLNGGLACGPGSQTISCTDTPPPQAPVSGGVPFPPTILTPPPSPLPSPALSPPPDTLPSPDPSVSQATLQYENPSEPLYTPEPEPSPAPVDCEMSLWENAGECVDLSMTQTRRVLTASQYGGNPCGPTEQRIPCVPPNAVVGRYVVLIGTCLNLLSVEVMSGGKDVALRKPTEMSSQLGNGFDPPRAVDGDPSTMAHTACVGKADYWQVDLGGEFPVSEIRIRNRTDCCQDRFVGVRVEVRDSSKTALWSTIIDSVLPMYTLRPLSTDPAAPSPVDCVQGPWEDAGTCASGLINQTRRTLVASQHGGTPCAPSSQTVPCVMPPVNCVQGPWEDAGTCANSLINQTRRTITASQHGGTPCGPSSQTVPCVMPSATQNAVVGRYVLLLQGNEVLNIAMVEVISGGVDVALRKPTEMSSTFSSLYVSSNAVDGNPNTFMHTARGGDQEYWQVDLGEEYPISEIRIRNRPDCCQDRIVGASVEIRNSAKAPVWRTVIGSVLPLYTLRPLATDPQVSEPTRVSAPPPPPPPPTIIRPPPPPTPTNCVLGRVQWGDRNTENRKWVYRGHREVLQPALHGGACDNPLQTSIVEKGANPGFY